MSVTSVSVQLTAAGPGELWLEYTVATGGALFLPAQAEPRRANELWKSTCFELFIQPLGSTGYREFNFSPSFEWAAYEFMGHRSGRTDLATHDPEIIISTSGEWFFLAVEALPELPARSMRVGLSAVIEEVDGTKSYWALAHAPGEPDFHNDACFTLELTSPATP